MFSDNKEEGKKEPELKDIMVEEFPWYVKIEKDKIVEYLLENYESD